MFQWKSHRVSIFRLVRLVSDGPHIGIDRRLVLFFPYDHEIRWLLRHFDLRLRLWEWANCKLLPFAWAMVRIIKLRVLGFLFIYMQLFDVICLSVSRRLHGFKFIVALARIEGGVFTVFWRTDIAFRRIPFLGFEIVIFYTKLGCLLRVLIYLHFFEVRS